MNKKRTSELPMEGERTTPRGSAPGAADAVAEGTRRLEVAVGVLLRCGTFGSLAIMLLGAIVTLAQHPEYIDHGGGLAAIREPHAVARSLPAMFAGLSRGEGGAIMLLGLLLLVATPVARVLISALAFLRLGDRTFAALTTLVLLLLIASFLLGKSG